MAFSDNDLHAIIMSLKVSGLALAAFLAPGTLVGLWLGLGRSKLRDVVNLICTLPLVVPPVVTGILLLKLLLVLGLPLAFTWWAAALASGIVAAPLLIRTVSAAAENTDARLLTVAASLGAGRARSLATIVAPLCWRGILGGALLFWARAMGEFGAVMVVAGN
ncbi:MAG TPA: ABC transporter permease subunit, partial [Phycisphaerae bacterium]|nr:ABC transporter permease subunit [Phycisphaerae bacterium]